MATIQINGTTYVGSHLRMRSDGTVTIDGESFKVQSPKIQITVDGDLESLEARKW